MVRAFVPEHHRDRFDCTAVTLGVHVLYHAVETYFITPAVYGSRLRLSLVAVLLAFTAGAELGGIVGAPIALPLAAIYPIVERVRSAIASAGLPTNTHGSSGARMRIATPRNRIRRQVLL
jgi:hypothetical protein